MNIKFINSFFNIYLAANSCTLIPPVLIENSKDRCDTLKVFFSEKTVLMNLCLFFKTYVEKFLHLHFCFFLNPSAITALFLSLFKIKAERGKGMTAGFVLE